jgi:endonuclease/exonuclease/phosphatase family metal-dependent hydrolase
MVALRLVNWNVNGRLSSLRAREAIARILRSLRPDVVCLQEVNRRAHAHWLAAALGMRFSDRWWHVGGVAILSRWPAERAKVRSIPSSYFGGFVAIKTRGLWVAVVHLDSRAYLHSERRRQAETAFVLRHFRPRSAAIIAGDWNSLAHVDLPPQRPDDDSRLFGCKLVRDLGRLPSLLLHDAGWRDVHQGPNAQTTWIPALAEDPRCPVERIDRIYAAGPVRVTHQQTLGPADFAHLFAPNTPRWPTGKDHLIVAAILHVPFASR